MKCFGKQGWRLAGERGEKNGTYSRRQDHLPVSRVYYSSSIIRNTEHASILSRKSTLLLYVAGKCCSVIAADPFASR